jgi:hypothetical protein
MSISESLKLIQEYTKRHSGPWIVTAQDNAKKTTNYILGIYSIIADKWIINPNKNNCIHFLHQGREIYLGSIILWLDALQNGQIITDSTGQDVLVFHNVIWQQNIHPDFYPEMIVTIKQFLNA